MNELKSSPAENTVLAADALPRGLRTALRMEGFEFTLAEVWGKVIEKNTAFLEIGSHQTLAWIYQPETESFLGERLQLVGPPELTVPEALRQLQTVLQADAQSGAVALMNESLWDTTEMGA